MAFYSHTMVQRPVKSEPMILDMSKHAFKDPQIIAYPFRPRDMKACKL
jgi:hypothetical protein